MLAFEFDNLSSLALSKGGVQDSGAYVSESVSGTPQGRQSDFDFINFSEATAIIKEEGIIVQSYESMQRFWQTR